MVAFSVVEGLLSTDAKHEGGEEKVTGGEQRREGGTRDAICGPRHFGQDPETIL